MKIRILLAASIFATSLATPALAQQGDGKTFDPAKREARFNEADKNADGKLDKAEWLSILPDDAQDRADQIWSARVDADGDGFITKAQFMALRMGPRPASN